MESKSRSVFSALSSKKQALIVVAAFIALAVIGAMLSGCTFDPPAEATPAEAAANTNLNTVLIIIAVVIGLALAL